ncbi:tetratricopeptide repeat protein [Porticoccus sp. GXU_MW_L64]
MLSQCKQQSILSVFFFSTLLYLLPASVFAASDPLKLLDDKWLEVKTENFHIISDAKEKKVKAFARDLEIFRHFAQIFTKAKIIDDAPPFKIFAIEDRSHFRKLRSRPDIAGYFFERLEGNFSAANISGYSKNIKTDHFPRQILFHEYIHFMLKKTGRMTNYPVWYEEGIADFLSTMVIDKKTIKYGLHSRARSYGISQTFGNKVPIEKLLKATEYPEKQRERSSFYNYAWALQHFFFSNKEYQDSVKNYLLLWNQGVDVDTAFKQSFDVSYDELGERLKMYLKTSNYKYAKYTFKEPFKTDFKSIRTLDKSEVAFHFGQMQWLREDFREDGRLLLQKAAQLNPDLIEANTYLLRDQWLQNKNIEHALQAIEKLHAEHPYNTDINTLYGNLLLSKAQALNDHDPDSSYPVVKQARSKYRQAIKADSQNLQAWWGMGEVYKQRPELTAEGQGMVEAATVLKELTYLTGDKGNYFVLALLYEQQGELDTAIGLYRRLANNRSQVTDKAKARLKKLLPEEPSLEVEQ